MLKHLTGAVGFELGICVGNIPTPGVKGFGWIFIIEMWLWYVHKYVLFIYIPLQP